MSNLTETGMLARKFIIWLVILTFAWIMLRFIYGIGIAYWKSTHLPPPPPPDMKYGILPKLTFPQNSSVSGQLVIRLENIEGKPPEVTAAAKIFQMPKKTSSILTIEKANKYAENLGFVPKPQVLNPNYYYYIDKTDPARSLLLDIINLNFDIKYDYLKDPAKIFQQARFSGKNESIVKDITGYLSSKGLFDATLLTEEPLIQFQRFDMSSKKFTPVEKAQDADSLKAYFFRSKINGLKVLTPGFDKSFNYVLYTPSAGEKYLEISKTFWPVDFSDFATYPLKSSQAAWDELVGGKGYIARMGNNTPDKIVVRDIYLAYFDSGNPENFIQPIFVFEGDNGFAAYTDAISPESVR